MYESIEKRSVTMNTQFLDNEYWYGGVVHMGRKFPVGKDDKLTVNLITGEGVSDQYSPLFISSKGRYICSDKPFEITFKNGEINADGPAEVKLFSGFGTLKGAQTDAARRCFSADGRIPNEQFLRAPQYNTWIELMYNQNEKQILEYAHSLVDEGMEPGILMIDEGWAPDYGDYDFCARKFQNPKKMVDELHSLGFKVMLWITPHISPDSDCYRAIKNTDYLIRDKDGKVAVREWWNGFSCILDLTNPKACEWFYGKLKGVMDKYGVDGFKFDAGGAYLYRKDDKTYMQCEACEHTAAFDRFAAQFEYNELRCVWNCGGQPLVCRLQDKAPSWEHNDGIGMLIPNMLQQGILGYFFGCPDMVGGGDCGYFKQGQGSVDEELYLRWLAVSVLCPMMQFSISPKRILSSENFKTAKKLTELHGEYADLIVSLAKNAAKTGEPIMRSMEYEFPGEGFETVTDQFVLGSNLIVAPVLKKGAVTREVKLPSGKWRYVDGKIYDGGKVTVSAPIDCLPRFEKID